LHLNLILQFKTKKLNKLPVITQYIYIASILIEIPISWIHCLG